MFDKDGNITGEKDTLSYSAITSWKKSPADYRAHYYEGKQSFTSPYTIFGNEVHKLAEEGKLTIVDHPVGEYEHEVRLHVPLGGVPMIGFIDLLHKETNAVTDLKTGLKPWEQVDVQRLEQLPIYVAMLRETRERVSLWTHLVWIGTRWVEDSKEKVSVGGFEAECGDARHLELTGEQKHYKRRVYLSDMNRVTGMVKQVACEIYEDFELWKLKKN